MADALPLVSLRAATLGYEDAAVFRDVDLDIRAGDLIAIAGPNGSGKTTMFRIDSRISCRFSAARWSRNCALSEFGYVPQSSALDSTFPITAREVVEMGGYGRLKPYQRFTAVERTALGRGPPTGRFEPARRTAVFFSVGRAAPAYADRARAHGRPENSYSGRAAGRRAIPNRRRRSAICWST